MTRRTNARVAGFAFLVYIAVAFPAMVLSTRATAGSDAAAKLASVGQHLAEMRIIVILTLASAMCAIVLAVTLFAITRDEDEDLARLAMFCRLGEGIVGSFAVSTLGLIWLATTNGGNAPDAAGKAALVSFFLKRDVWSYQTAAILFAIGSTIFAYLLLRGRTIPVALAWLGVIASALAVIELPLEMAGYVRGLITQLVWLPVAVFELTVALWLIVKGAAPPRREVVA